MMFYITVFTVFLIQILTTRPLNRGRLTSRLWRSVWAVELIFLGLILPALVLGSIEYARLAMAAGASVFLLRAGVRGYDYGPVTIIKKALPVLRSTVADLGSAIGEITTVLVGLFATVAMEFMKALPEAMADAVITSDKRNINSLGETDKKLGLHPWDFSKTDWDW